MFLRAIEFQPDFASAYYNLGCIYMRLKKARTAKRAIEQVVRIEPRNSEARLLLGQLYLLENDRGSAQIQYKVLAELNPDLAKELYAKMYSSLIVAADKTKK